MEHGVTRTFRLASKRSETTPQAERVSFLLSESLCPG